MKKRFVIITIVIAMMVAYMPTTVLAVSNAQAGTVGSNGEHPDGGIKCLPGGTFDLVTLDDVAGRQPVADNPGGRKGLGASSDIKTMPLLIIVVGFNDTPYNDEYDWGSTIFSARDGVYSLSKYYTDNSQGKFTFAPAQESSRYNDSGNKNVYDKSNDGIVHVSVDMDHDDWITVWHEGGANQGTWADAIGEAMNKADDVVDFSKYDANGNKSIETNEMALGFIIAGGEASNYYNQDYTDGEYLMWAHAWEMSDFMDIVPKCDNTTIDKYIAIAEDVEYYRYDYDDETEVEAMQAGIGTLAHELGHYLGLPDYYDTNGDDYGPWGNYAVGNASIMAGGNWCYIMHGFGDYEYVPSPFDAYSRVALKWVEPIEAELENTYNVTAQNYSARVGNSDYSVLKVPTQNEKEYYLIENKQFSGWDEALKTSYPENKSFAKTGGLVMWHIDEEILDEYWEDNEINTTYHRPGVMPTFMEYSGLARTYKFIGTRVDQDKIFLDENIYYNRITQKASDNINLPLYNKTDDKPASRTSSPYNLVLRGTGSNIKVLFTKKDTSVIVAEEQAAAAANKAANDLKEWNGTYSGAVPAAKSVKAKAAKKSVKVSWKKAKKKVLKKFDKVEIKVCPDKGFQMANTKRVVVKKSKKSATVKGLVKGKTYYVRVRNVKGSGTGKLVSKWSGVKKVKIKK